MSLKNKIAIVTGSRRGIGLGIAEELAREGCNVVISDIDQKDCEAVAEEIKKMGVDAIGVACDVSQKSDVENLIKQTVKKFGRIDIMVNNAGIYPFKPFLELSEDDWNKVININLKSVFFCSQEAAKNMGEGGRIISISSIASLVGFEGLAHYCASKGGINGLTRAMALELAHKKITVNAVAPGAIQTPGASGGSEEQTKQTIAMIPAARMGEPADIANAVAFLASEKSDYITGQVIVVDGGWTLR
ncbi:MAG TPA: SDR family NAD(P)-dependent oxidoreductase [Candidatus Nanoarchaeia archaeon]|nr:SDR family NAD(P)-dependent oxidoreductase [Candidatus Nanoarchaeia archaeon]